MKVFVIAATSLKRLFRDRTNIFFVLLLPMLLILVLGSAFGGSHDPKVGVVMLDDGNLARQLAEKVAHVDGIEVADYDSREEVVLAVERGSLQAAVIIPRGLTSAVEGGRQTRVDFVAREDASAQGLRNTIEAAVAEEGLVYRAARFAARESQEPVAAALARAVALKDQTAGISIQSRTVGEPFPFDTLGSFDLGAYSQLLTFIFITSTTGSTALIQSRQLGVSRRMLATPTSVRTVLVGELLGRYAVALLQGLIIIVGTTLMFDVNWGDPVGAAAIYMLFALVAAAVGTLMGATFENDQQAGAIGVGVGIGMAALGGSMLPLTLMKIFAPVMYTVAHITPHAWGIEAFEELILYGRTVADILPQLAILAGYAIVLVALAAWRLRVALTRA